MYSPLPDRYPPSQNRLFKKVIPKMDGNQEKMDAWRKETTACPEAMEDCLEETEAYLERKEPTPEEIEAEEEQREVPNYEADVKTVGAGKDRYGDRHLAVGRRREPKNGPKTTVGPSVTFI
jgi:hypothetical protein